MPHKKFLLDFSRPLAFMFDLDGTILNSTEWHMQAFRETLATYAPHKIPELNKAGEAIIKGRGSENVFLALGFTDKELVTKLVEHKREVYKAFIQNGSVCLYPGVKDLIDFLKTSRHRTLILVTSSSNNIATLCLEAHGLNQEFDDIVTGEQVACGKPAPDIFQYALRRAKLKPSQAVVIEDSEIGIQASIAADIPAVLVNQEKDSSDVPTFGSVTELYYRVCSDFKKAEPDIFSKAILLEQDISNITWDQSFGREPEGYNPTSDRELFNLLKLASEREEDVRLLRIGGPLLFRRMVVSYLEEMGNGDNRATKALLDQRIHSIKFLIADPDGAPFLTKLDDEEAGTWGIWHVRYQTLRFAEGACALATHRNGELEVGFHQGELIWNLGIVGQTAILVRAYGGGTGHDNSVASRWMITGEKIFLAESFTNYWDSIYRRKDTIIMKFGLFKDIKIPKWSSLYKGNAVLSNKDDLDREDRETSVPDKYVPKICRYPDRQEAEEKWVSLTEKQREDLENFRPVKKAYPVEKLLQPLGREPFYMERLKGFSLFEIANEISINEKSKENPEAASRLLGEILLDSLKALEEFRDRANSVISYNKRESYPYETQLIDALNEVKSLIEPILSDVFDKVIKDIAKLEKNLKSQIIFPFRDAQLKNRIWVTDESISEMVSRLLTIDRSDLQSEMKNIRDIDFETSVYNVTQWDDVIHILFFEKSGLFFETKKGTFTASIDPTTYYKICLKGQAVNETGLWMTVLARSIREFCRRLWYARTMPTTYKRRYKHERRDYFLDLALYALQKLSNYENIRKLLTIVKESPDIWPSSIVNDKDNEDIDKSKIVDFDLRLISQIISGGRYGYDYDVAISCARENIEYVETIANYLRDNNLKVYFYEYDKEQLKSLGMSLTNHLQYIFRDASKHCVMFISKHYLSSKWTKFEKDSAVDRELNEEGYIIPVRFDETQVPGLHSTKHYYNVRKKSLEEVCKHLLQKLKE